MSGNGSTQARVLGLDAKDNVLVALTDLRKGETLSYLENEYALLSDVPAKHKFLTQDVSAGGDCGFKRPYDVYRDIFFAAAATHGENQHSIARSDARSLKPGRKAGLPSIIVGARG